MKLILIVSLLFILPACVSPLIDESVDGFDENTYHTDLYECRGGSLIEASAVTIGNAAVVDTKSK